MKQQGEKHYVEQQVGGKIDKLMGEENMQRALLIMRWSSHQSQQRRVNYPLYRKALNVEDIHIYPVITVSSHLPSFLFAICLLLVIFLIQSKIERETVRNYFFQLCMSALYTHHHLLTHIGFTLWGIGLI